MFRDRMGRADLTRRISSEKPARGELALHRRQPGRRMRLAESVHARPGRDSRCGARRRRGWRRNCARGCGDYCCSGRRARSRCNDSRRSAHPCSGGLGPYRWGGLSDGARPQRRRGGVRRGRRSQSTCRPSISCGPKSPSPSTNGVFSREVAGRVPMPPTRSTRAALTTGLTVDDALPDQLRLVGGRPGLCPLGRRRGEASHAVRVGVRRTGPWPGMDLSMGRRPPHLRQRRDCHGVVPRASLGDRLRPRLPVAAVLASPRKQPRGSVRPRGQRRGVDRRQL
jgi:hypothetical protein